MGHSKQLCLSYVLRKTIYNSLKMAISMGFWRQKAISNLKNRAVNTQNSNLTYQDDAKQCFRLPSDLGQVLHNFFAVIVTY